nr:MAG TPA: hypothetical protein [Caudoviricetes sp.]
MIQTRFLYCPLYHLAKNRLRSMINKLRLSSRNYSGQDEHS